VIAALVDIAPGAQTGWHLHWFPVYAYVLSGTLQVELEDGRTNVFKQGQVIVEVQKLSHNGRNIGSDPVRLIVFYTGEAGQTPSVTTPRADQDRGQPPPGTGD
jgi:quercetin dioxygenase-like cupin family protein